jgi:endoglucanase
MKRTVRQSLVRLCLFVVVALAAAACTPEDGTDAGTGGTAAATGGRPTGVGGSVTANGGTAAATGGSATDNALDAASMAIDMRLGANIGNTLENTFAWETGWGQPLITQQFINGMAANGIKTVRVPVAWNTYAVNGVVQSDKMARVREVVQWILNAGMYVIVNIHWDGGWIKNEGNANVYRLTDDVRSKYRSYWQQIAAAFADVGNRLIFEAQNEDGEFYLNGDKAAGADYAPLNELNQLFVSTVRGSSGYNKTRNLLIAGYVTNIDMTCVDAFAIPSDPAGAGKLFLSIHYYAPYPFCCMSEPADWGGWVYPATTWGTPAEKAELQTLFSKLAAFCAARKVTAIIGEFCVITGSGAYVRDPASRVLWMKSIIETARTHGMVPLLWDTGGDINRTDGSFSTELTAVKTQLGL